MKMICIKNMMRIKAGLLLAGVLVLSLAMLLAVSAEALTWTMSLDETTLSCGTEQYYLHELPIGYSRKPHSIYVYANTEDSAAGWDIRVYAPYEQADIVWNDWNNSLYVSREGEQELETFYNGEVSFFRIEDAGGYECLIEQDTVDALNEVETGSSELAVETDVRDLQDAICYNLMAYDSTETICFVYGAIYELDGSLFYLNYQKLGNEHFTADGSFSYRSGSVLLTPIDSVLSGKINEHLEDLVWYSPEYVYEEDVNDYYDSFYNDDTAVFFWINIVFFGLLLPIVPLLLGLLLPRSAKLGYPKYWYILAAIAVAWIALSGLLILLLLI